MNKQVVLILCKVIDNYGDIGVAYRLAKALSRLRPSLALSLAVSDLAAFKLLCPRIDSAKTAQRVLVGNAEWLVADWNARSARDAQTDPDDLGIIIECFQCGRPAWLEDALFSDGFSRTVHIVDIDYLTAEEYADEFHLLKSGTRKTSVKKILFMPGFTQKTGGLIFERTEPLPAEQNVFRVLVFSYGRDFLPVVRAMRDFGRQKKTENPSFSLCALVAAGKSAAPFRAAWEALGRPFRAEFIDFLPQERWDALLASCDFAFVRGEDSLSRACLLGIPFVWHAYAQEDDYQLVKVSALLSRMEPFFETRDFEALSDAWKRFNTSERGAGENATRLEENIRRLLGRRSVRAGFAAFGASLIRNGDLAAHLLEYIDSL